MFFNVVVCEDVKVFTRDFGKILYYFYESREGFLFFCISWYVGDFFCLLDEICIWECSNYLPEKSVDPVSPLNSSSYLLSKSLERNYNRMRNIVFLNRAAIFCSSSEPDIML